MSNRSERRAAEHFSRKVANQANSQLSTGPVTAQGKAIAARNSLKHGLTGNTVLLDSDDADRYQAQLDYYTKLYKPADFEECRLVQSIHDTTWRLDRITNLEATLYAKGRMDLADAYQNLPSDHRKNFIDLETGQRCAKDLRNLHIQEARLQRQRTKDLAALKQLQTERAAQAEAAAKSTTAKPSHAPIGFVFATPEIAQNASASAPILTESARLEAA